MKYKIEAVRPTKKKGAVVANVIVTFAGVLRVRFKLVNGSKGLFLGMPSAPYRGSRGVSSHVDYVSVLDKGLRRRIEADAVQALSERLAADGRQPPRPLERKPNRIRLLLESAALEIGPDTPGRVVDYLQNALTDGRLSGREKLAACKILTGLLDIHWRALVAPPLA